MTTKLVYLIRRCKSNQSSVRAGISCEATGANYVHSIEMDTTGMKMSDILAVLTNQFTLKTVA